jgi:hypothetical protein
MERDAVSEILRQAHLEGRIDNDEFQERVERCLTAKTYAELDALIADLPREWAGERWAARHAGWRPWPVPFMLLPLALIVAIAVGSHVAWLAIPLFFFFVVRPLAWRAQGWSRGPRRSTRLLAPHCWILSRIDGSSGFERVRR